MGYELTLVHLDSGARVFLVRDNQLPFFYRMCSRLSGSSVGSALACPLVLGKVLVSEYAFLSVSICRDDTNV